jgi:hypothetical protein
MANQKILDFLLRQSCYLVFAYFKSSDNKRCVVGLQFLLLLFLILPNVSKSHFNRICTLAGKSKFNGIVFIQFLEASNTPAFGYSTWILLAYLLLFFICTYCIFLYFDCVVNFVFLHRHSELFYV